MKSEIVSVSERRYSYFESGKNEADEFYALYELPLMNDCYVQFLFHYVSNDRVPDPRLAQQAHAMIDRMMQSVTVNVADSVH